MSNDQLKKKYQTPLERYSSKEMSHLFSPEYKFEFWRKIWVALAEAEQELGIEITDEQIAELKRFVHLVNYDVADAIEKEKRHDVMAHILAYGQQAKLAAGIIHLGATSMTVVDNTDAILMHEALYLIHDKIIGTIKYLADFADQYKHLVTLGSTHGQAAQLTTVGKRATLWIQNFEIALHMIDHAMTEVKLLGCKGTTGTAESFMQLFDGDEEKARRLDVGLAEKLGFCNGVFSVSGQTYPRVVDTIVLDALKYVAEAAHKFAGDMRLLQRAKELMEPFGANQIGSSAMAYKQNPMRAERICSLSRDVIVQPTTAAWTDAVQWLERSLDDSAGKRRYVPEMFLGVDAVLIIVANIAKDIRVFPKVIARHVADELPFMATEAILMEAVKQGGNRQDLHELIRVHSMEASDRVMNGDGKNDLLDRLAGDKAFPMPLSEIRKVAKPEKLCGRAPSQVTEYLTQVIYPLLDRNSQALTDINSDVKV